MSDLDAMVEWPVIVEEIRHKHNGVFSVNLYFGHDGHNVCKFETYGDPGRRTIARGESGRSMQEAVERCVDSWRGRPSGAAA